MYKIWRPLTFSLTLFLISSCTQKNPYSDSKNEKSESENNKHSDQHISNNTKRDYPPFSINDVGFTKDCGPNNAFIRLMTLIKSPVYEHNDEDKVPDFDEPLFNAVNGATSQRIYFTEPETWNDLQFTGVENLQGIESGPNNYTMFFDDSSEKVITKFKKLGWNLPPAGEMLELSGKYDSAEVSIGVKEEDETRVTCYRD